MAESARLNPHDNPKPDFIVFDLETTGFDVRTHEIIEIGAVRVSSDLTEIRGTFEEQIQPLHIERAMPDALAVNGYSDEGWKGAKTLHDALGAFCTFGSGGILAAYNITFDWSFLHMALLKEAIEPPFEYHRFDIFTLAYEYVLATGASEMKLRAMCARFNIPLPPEPHRALADARAALAVFRAIRA